MKHWQSAVIYLARKSRDMLATLLLMSLIVFLVFELIPGDPIQMILGTQGTPEKRTLLEQELHLNEAPTQRYIRSVKGLFSKADPSRSLRFRQPVRQLIGQRLQLTITLALTAFGLVILLSLPMALWCAHRPGSWLDRGMSSLSQVLMAIPGFFLGILLILLTSGLLKTFTRVNYVPPQEGLFASVRSLFLPALAVALPRLAWGIQFLRTSILEQKQKDYVRTARAFGANSQRVLTHHILRNSLLPYLTSMGLILADLLTGSLIVEQVFVLPGSGRLLLTAIESRDFPLAQGIILTLSFLVVLVGWLTDLVARWVDPRLDRLSGTGSRGEASS